MKRICIVAVLGILILIGALQGPQAAQGQTIPPVIPPAADGPTPEELAQWLAQDEADLAAMIIAAVDQLGGSHLMLSRSLSDVDREYARAQLTVPCNSLGDDRARRDLVYRYEDAGYIGVTYATAFTACGWPTPEQVMGALLADPKWIDDRLRNKRLTDLGVAYAYNINTQQGRLVIDFVDGVYTHSALLKRAWLPEIAK